MDKRNVDLYAELRVPRTATLEQIKKAHKRRVNETHPDRHPGKIFEFRCVQYAYEVLSNPARRQRYDETGQHDELKTPSGAEVLIMMFRQIVEADDFEPTEDPVKVIKKALTIRAGKIKEKEQEFRAHLERNQTMLGRLIYKGKEPGKGVLGDLLQNAIANLRNNLVQLDLERQQHLEAEQLIDSYDFQLPPTHSNPDGITVDELMAGLQRAAANPWFDSSYFGL